MDLFTGVGVALVTLLDDDGGVDVAATASLAADLAGRGMQAVLACGTTGEAGSLTDAERSEVIRAVRDAVPPDVPVLAGTGATSPGRAAELTAAAAAAGADAVLAWPPPGSEDLAGYFATVAAVSSAARAGLVAPVPASTGTSGGTASRTARMTSLRSASVRAPASPVVPQASTACMPRSDRSAASEAVAATSTPPPSSSRVTRATPTPVNKSISDSALPALARPARWPL